MKRLILLCSIILIANTSVIAQSSCSALLKECKEKTIYVGCNKLKEGNPIYEEGVNKIVKLAMDCPEERKQFEKWLKEDLQKNPEKYCGETNTPPTASSASNCSISNSSQPNSNKYENTKIEYSGIGNNIASINSISKAIDDLDIDKDNILDELDKEKSEKEIIPVGRNNTFQFELRGYAGVFNCKEEAMAYLICDLKYTSSQKIKLRNDSVWIKEYELRVHIRYGNDCGNALLMSSNNLPIQVKSNNVVNRSGQPNSSVGIYNLPCQDYISQSNQQQELTKIPSKIYVLDKEEPDLYLDDVGNTSFMTGKPKPVSYQAQTLRIYENNGIVINLLFNTQDDFIRKLNNTSIGCINYYHYSVTAEVINNNNFPITIHDYPQIEFTGNDLFKNNLNSNLHPPSKTAVLGEFEWLSSFRAEHKGWHIPANSIMKLDRSLNISHITYQPPEFVQIRNLFRITYYDKKE
jgi:hypothetical protein